MLSRLIDQLKTRNAAQYDQFIRFVKFCLVGASGVGVNVGAYWVLTRIFHLSYLIANPISIQVSILTNFLLNDIWTWRDRRTGGIKRWARRMIEFTFVANITAFAVQYLTLIILTGVFHMNDLISLLIGIGLGTILNFTVNHLWVFRKVN